MIEIKCLEKERKRMQPRDAMGEVGLIILEPKKIIMDEKLIE
jgi:hypothetical protein